MAGGSSNQHNNDNNTCTGYYNMLIHIKTMLRTYMPKKVPDIMLEGTSIMELKLWTASYRKT